MGKKERNGEKENGNRLASEKMPPGKWFLRLGSWILLCFLAPALVFVFMLSVSRIPRELIWDNARESIGWILEKGTYTWFLNEDDRGTEIDSYFDAQLLDIAIYLDEGRPVETVVKCPYYLNEELYTALKDLMDKDGETASDTEYARYWNGTAGVLRLLLLFWDLSGIYRFQIFLGLALLAVILLLLWRKGEVSFLLAFLAGLWCVGADVISANVFCMPVFVIMAGMMILVLLKKDARLAPFFLLCGSFTACFDNLSAETLTVSMSLLLAMVLAYRRGELRRPGHFFRYGIRSCALWGTGYLSAFLFKWGLGCLILGPHSLQVVADSAEYRLFLGGGDTFQRILIGLFHPFTYLRPFSWTDTWGQLLVAALAAAIPAFCLLYLFGKRSASCTPVSLLLIPAAIPFLRFVILNAHTWGHMRIVYRALLVAVTAVLCLALESLRLPAGKRLNRQL